MLTLDTDPSKAPWHKTLPTGLLTCRHLGFLQSGTHMCTHTHTLTQLLRGSGGLPPSYPPFLTATLCMAHQMPSRPSFQMLGSQRSDHSCLWRWRQSAHPRQVRAQLHTEGRVLQKGALEKRLPCWDLGHQASHQLRVSKLLFKRKKYIILFIKMGNFSS